MPNKEEYLDEVCKQIRFGAARKYLRQELAAHIDDKKEEYLKNAAPDAEEQAVASMGDAAETGRALNTVHRPRTEWGVIACMALLIMTGFLLSAADANLISGWSVSHETILFLCACALGFACFSDYSLIMKLRYAFIACAFAILALYIWKSYDWNVFLAQSSVIAFTTLFFLLSIFGFIEKRKSQGFAGLLMLIALCSVTMLAMALVMATLFSLLIAVASAAALGYSILSSGAKLSTRIAQLTITILALATVQILIMNIRFFHVIQVFGFETNIGGYNISPAFIFEKLSTAKMIGASMSSIENEHTSGTSFILTSIILRYGWLAAIALALVFITLIVFMVRRIISIKHHFGRIMSIGIGAFILIRFILCLLANTGLIGGLSCNLPFVSFGYSNLITDSFLIGLFLSVWRRSSFMKDNRLDIGPAEDKENDTAIV